MVTFYTISKSDILFISVILNNKHFYISDINDASPTTTSILNYKYLEIPILCVVSWEGKQVLACNFPLFYIAIHGLSVYQLLNG